MNKNSFTKYSLVLLVLSIILISGCSSSGGSNKVLANFHTGTNGITANFLSNFPPTQANYKENFNIALLVANKGAENAENVKILLTGYSSQLYAITPEISTSDNINVENNVIVLRKFEGRSVTNNDGQQEVIMYSARPAIKEMLPGDSFPVMFIANVCYGYKSTFSGEACIDPFINTPNYQSAKPCKVSSTIQSSGGQGGPVSISKIEQQMILLSGDKSKTQFKIYINNVGNGEVMRKSAYEKMCSTDVSSVVNENDIGVVTISAVLGTKSMACFLPGEEKAATSVDLKLGDPENNYVLCKADTSNFKEIYLTQLSITAEYGYVGHAEARMTVKRDFVNK